MWAAGFAIEVFGRGPWPGMLTLLVFRDDHLICTGRLLRSRAQGCRKFLAALKALMLRTTYTDKEGKRRCLWDSGTMKRLWQQHKCQRRPGSTWYTWKPLGLHTQTTLSGLPRDARLWPKEPSPNAGLEFLEGLEDHLALVLLLPKTCRPPAAQQLLCYTRPVVEFAKGLAPTPRWVPLPPERMHCAAMREPASGACALVLRPVVW